MQTPCLPAMFAFNGALTLEIYSTNWKRRKVEVDIREGTGELVKAQGVKLSY